MTKCDICKVETEHANSVVVHFWGGEEYRWLVCRRCGLNVEHLIIDMRDKAIKGEG